MGRRKAKGRAAALGAAIGRVPPLAGVALALVSYFVMHRLAQAPLASALVGIPGYRGAAAAMKSLASAAQYALPAVFIVAALLSLGSRLLRKPPPGLAPDASAMQAAAPMAREPRTEHDIHALWAGEWDDAPENHRTVDAGGWSLELLRAIEWKRFEDLCAAYFRVLGFHTRIAPPGADGGVDIHLIPDGADQPGVLVQCKAWNSYDVGVKAVRELLGAMAAQGVPEGVFVTTGRYTHAARDFAPGKEIILIDGPDLLDKILALRDEHRASLLAIATQGDFMRPTCPSCGVKMVRRIARASGDPFWGCTNFPGCRTTLRIAAEAA